MKVIFYFQALNQRLPFYPQDSLYFLFLFYFHMSIRKYLLMIGFTRYLAGTVNSNLQIHEFSNYGYDMILRASLFAFNTCDKWLDRFFCALFHCPHSHRKAQTLVQQFLKVVTEPINKKTKISIVPTTPTYIY